MWAFSGRAGVVTWSARWDRGTSYNEVPMVPEPKRSGKDNLRHELGILPIGKMQNLVEHAGKEGLE